MKVEVSGGYSVAHSAAIANVSRLSVGELRALRDACDALSARVIEGSASQE
ncbi:hypothetical protein LBMAG42_54510 [Deltaproteobacteria bacterium]|nr:hypothetical protein LBMAG42_54510 [Deltaproteobacteria bacterium]